MDTNAPAPMEGSAPLSTTLDTGIQSGPAGQGQAPLTEKAPDPKPESAGDTLRSELAKVREQESKAEAKDDKAKAEEKPAKPEDDKQAKARADDGKFARKAEEPADKAEQSAAEKPATERAPTDERQSEGRKHAEPPARFLPEARAKWANVPNEVKAEFHRVEQEREAEVAQYRESHENWQKLSKFDQMAKQHSTSVSDALERYTAVDGLLNSNPVEGIRRVLETIGLTPEQYAQHVMSNPQAHVPQQHAYQPQQQSSPEIAALKAEIEAMRTDQMTQRIAPVIQNFAASHPDYHALEPQIAEILGSGIVDRIYGAGLSPEQKLAEAYRMAGGSSPSRSEPPVAAAHSAPSGRPVDPAGQKSIRGAPNGGQEPDDDTPETDIRAVLRSQMRKSAA